MRLWYVDKRPAWRGNRNLDLIENRDHRDRLCAIIIVRRASPGYATSSSGVPPSNHLELYNELMIQMRALPTHPSIVDLYDVFINKDFVVVLRRCEEGPTIEDFFPLAKDRTASRVFGQLADAIRNMHSIGVVHINLHCDNTVFDASDSEFLRPRLIDIKIAFWIQHLATSDANNFDPTCYISPELRLMASEANARPDQCQRSGLNFVLNDAWKLAISRDD
ncbi:hypothetical protein Mp_3g12810 [Marchantia polymorpha subsp. ruderalis]|uniref:Protein kinase domain-containing protein n=2 Tax=Marchantia polymorpha TaxID=3197 RepID=A0AAF6B070_MARPO|nr:hypothetical protein MARPO_0050s0073 [Marchantia polymorpha]BBN05404.1 hypothetical protein Mp_3g12810 [Marchantia polymorpha subsp. ruderalis]|eukprot:PTQ38617.1 hypothetical protein MARPO_0050s0073 [Marchantia polymorpha]